MLSLSWALWLLIAGMTKHESKRVGGKQVLQNQAFWHVRPVPTFGYKTLPNWIYHIKRVGGRLFCFVLVFLKAKKKAETLVRLLPSLLIHLRWLTFFSVSVYQACTSVDVIAGLALSLCLCDFSQPFSGKRLLEISCWGGSPFLPVFLRAWAFSWACAFPAAYRVTVGSIIVASISIHVPADHVPTHRNPLPFSFSYSLHDVLEHINLPVIYVLH